ncbi:MAG: AAA family ATPase [Firmicutes bacterium]|nr:AAA family ATPase [Bacillota bacterium]
MISWEERRVEEDLEKIAQARDKKVYIWTFTQGLTTPAGTYHNDTTREPMLALDYILQSRESAIFILKDFHPFFERADVVRKMRDVAISLRTSYDTVVLLSPVLKVPAELEKDITVIDYPLPDYKDLDELLEKLIQSVKRNPQVKINLPSDDREKLIKAAQGLTTGEAENVFAKALVMNNSLDAEDIGLIISEKEQIIRKSGVLTYYESDESLSAVGGMENLKEWLKKRASAFSEKARKFGLPEPKGILLLGVQGCGKSLCAKAISAEWHLPLLRLDVGSLFSGIIGSTEENARKAIKIAENISPCVLWLDEIEKGFSGVESSGATDAGTTARIFATFLSWLQEKTSPVFVVATANEISKLPPELLRKGRFDEIFFVDLPSEAERKEIFMIHIRKRSRDPANFDIERLVADSEGFSGAEIEEAVISALYDAFSEGGELNTDRISNAIKQTFPLSKTMQEDMEALRKWASARTRYASSNGGDNSRK